MFPPGRVETNDKVEQDCLRSAWTACIDQVKDARPIPATHHKVGRISASCISIAFSRFLARFAHYSVQEGRLTLCWPTGAEDRAAVSETVVNDRGMKRDTFSR